MPGANCAFPGCNVSRYKLHEDTAIFNIKKRKSESSVSSAKVTRDTDLVLKEKLQNGDADFFFFFCKRHFASDDIEYTSKF